MDLLQTCAEGFERLLPYRYHIIVGRKGKTLEFTISFDRADFHHLAGLHKLTDNVRFLTGKRDSIMQEVLTGRLTLSQAQQSAFFCQMEPRLKPLAHLEEFLDSNEIIFRYTCFWLGVRARIRRCAVLFSRKQRKITRRGSRVTHC